MGGNSGRPPSMTLPRFFLPGMLHTSDSINVPNQELVIRGGDAHHISQVLRLRPSDRVVLVDAHGVSVVAAITAVKSDAVSVVIEEYLLEQQEPGTEVWLAQGLPKGDKMDFIVQKAVELGAAGIIPLLTQNVVVRYNSDKCVAKVERWRKIAREAAKQARRTVIPAVADVQALPQLLRNVTGNGEQAFLLYEGKTATTLKTALAQADRRRYIIIIGPEGGFTPGEVAAAQAAGVTAVTLGPRILRTETAAVAALAVVMYHAGELGG